MNNRLEGELDRENMLESVNFANSIQKRGVLLVLDDELAIVGASANTDEYLSLAPDALLGQPLNILCPETEIAMLRKEFERLASGGYGTKSRSRLQGNDERRFTATLYRSADHRLLELEPVSVEGETPPEPARIHQIVSRLRSIADLSEFLQQSAVEIRSLNGFDRVMVYRFDERGAGEVVAEAKRKELSPYLGLHYPATDIPEPVRELYQRSMVRYLPDLGAGAVEILRGENCPPHPLELRLAELRSVDACCVEYHRNMNVAALFVLPLTRGDRLWGLISCHHGHPKTIASEVRDSCQLLSGLIASELADKVNTQELKYLTKLRSLQSDFLRTISEADDLKQALIQPAPRLLDLVNATGAAVCLEDEITLVGETPTLEQIRALLQWTETRPSDPSGSHPALLHTDSLPSLYEEALEYKEQASGLLVLTISRVRRYTILWFRPEVLQMVDWAGDPNTSRQVAADGQITLCPRASFERWREIVRCTSLSWQAGELENALDLRGAIIGIVLKKAEELAKVNRDLENTVRELDSFAYAASHDLKEPLRGIHNFSNLLLKGYAEVLDETGKSRLQTLIRLTRRMENLIDALLEFSRIGQTELRQQPIALDRSLHRVLEDLLVSRPDAETEILVPRALPTVHCDPLSIERVFSNLISNAMKYNDKPDRWVEIGYLEDERQDSPIFYVRDNGIGIRERHLDSIFRLFKRLHEQHLYGGGTGAGLTIAKKIIEHHGGRLWVESTYGQGSTFYFTLNQESLSVGGKT
jgi:two-component system, chemotaxis family, sensor kinase Cph1